MPLWLNLYGLEGEKLPVRPTGGKTRKRGGVDMMPPKCKKSSCPSELDLGEEYIQKWKRKGRSTESEGWIYWTAVSEHGAKFAIAQPAMSSKVEALAVAITRMFPKRLLGYSGNCLVFPLLGKRNVKEHLIKNDASSTARLSLITEIAKLLVGFSQMVSEAKIESFPLVKASNFLVVGKDSRVIVPNPEAIITVCLALISKKDVLPTIYSRPVSPEPSWFCFCFVNITTELLSKSIRGQPVDYSLAKVGKSAFRKLRETMTEAKRGLLTIDQLASTCIHVRNRHTRKLDSVKVELEMKVQERDMFLVEPSDIRDESCALLADPGNFFSDGAYSVVDVCS
eukprot:TRINITY_DN9523_c0_g1_i1.p1 TRINITY_DN9523_c0_g1~~TRINITY_DN9523_c0_g1_i1.p1  ORF type:complete len:356 (+),score=42.59 TRINITY_DN9523_c0_g1_i1:52-1068(+)